MLAKGWQSSWQGWHEGLQRGWLEAGNGFGWLAGFTLACLLYSVV